MKKCPNPLRWRSTNGGIHLNLAGMRLTLCVRHHLPGQRLSTGAGALAFAAGWYLSANLSHFRAPTLSSFKQHIGV